MPSMKPERRPISPLSELFFTLYEKELKEALIKLAAKKRAEKQKAALDKAR